MQLVRWKDIAMPYSSLSFHTVCTIRQLVWATESFCSFFHFEIFLICIETANILLDGQTLPSTLSVCHFVRFVRSLIWSDQLNRFVRFVILKYVWFLLRQHTIGKRDRHCHPLFQFFIPYGLYDPSFGLTNWIDLFILSFWKSFELCWDSIQLVSWTDIASLYFSLSFRTVSTILHLVRPTESICSLRHFEKFLNCAETPYYWSDGQTLSSPILVCHLIWFVRSVIWSDQLNRFVHFVILKIFLILLRHRTISQLDRHCHHLFQFVISYCLYDPSIGLRIVLFILTFWNISDLYWDSIQLVRWADIAILYFSLSFRTVSMIRHSVWLTESICYVRHFEKFLSCAETAYYCSIGQKLPSPISVCQFVGFVQFVIWCDQLNRFVHCVILKTFLIVLRHRTISQLDRHCHHLFQFVNSYCLYDPSFGLTNWIYLFILSFWKMSNLCWDSIQSVKWTDIAIYYFCLSFSTVCKICHLVWPTESICSFCHLETFMICAQTSFC